MTEQSTDVTELAKAMAQAQAKIRNASKDSVNPHFGRSYADLASVWEACREPLTTNGLSIVQQPVSDGVKVGVVTTLLHASGQWMRSTIWTTQDRPGPQPMGSAITYCRRYSLSAFVGVAPDDDDDGEKATGRDKPAAAGGAARANTVKATPTALMANASQIQQIHILKEKIGGWTGKAEHPGHPYKLALAAYKNAAGAPCQSSKDVTYEQATNLIKRMQGMVDRQAETLANMKDGQHLEAAVREPGSDDDEPDNDNGEAPEAGLLQNVREAATSVWGKKAKDLAPQWLQKEFGVAETAALTKKQAAYALELLLSGDVLA